MKAFKSERAAKMAYTKAENAWEKMRGIAMAQNHEYSKTGWNNERFAHLRKLEADAVPYFEAMRAIYNQAKSQGFFIRSWHFGVNPTRDLIAANMD
jgi:hypothetical protein